MADNWGRTGEIHRATYLGHTRRERVLNYLSDHPLAEVAIALVIAGGVIIAVFIGGLALLR